MVYILSILTEDPLLLLYLPSVFPLKKARFFQISFILSSCCSSSFSKLPKTFSVFLSIPFKLFYIFLQA